MTSSDSRLFVWTWLPDHTEPVVAGVLEPGDRHDFAYGQSYLANSGAIALGPELPLEAGRLSPNGGAALAGCLRDATPDAWGQRVILYRLSGSSTGGRDTNELDLLTYLRMSGSNRFGAIDFQDSATDYVARGEPDVSLADLQSAADLIAAGDAVPDELSLALLHGTSVGGARPKVTLTDPVERIAKFSKTTDPYPVVKAEAAAMFLARAAGANVATTSITEVAGRSVLMVDRFDRDGEGHRRHSLSLLTLLGLDEMQARHATYHDFAALIRSSFVEPTDTLRELFRRIVINVAVSNTDDHARNHAAFWDGSKLELTPAFDICPQLRTGGYTEQAMAINPDGSKASQLSTCIDSANVFLLEPHEAESIVDETTELIRAAWPEAIDAARLTTTEAGLIWGRQVLHPAIFDEF